MSVPAPPRMVRGNFNLLSDECELADIANSRTTLLLTKLNIKQSFLSKHPSLREQDPEFSAAKETVKHIKVVNDKEVLNYSKILTNL